MTTLFFCQVKKENDKQFSEPFWHSFRPESAGNGILRLSDLKIFWGGMPPHPLEARAFGARKSFLDH